MVLEPITVHDVEVNFVGPVLIEMFVCGRAMPATVERILICARADLEPKVENPLLNCIRRFARIPDWAMSETIPASRVVAR